MQYVVIIEKGPTSYGAYVPDLPGCVAAAETEDEVRQLIREAIELHLEGLRGDGEPIPEPHLSSDLRRRHPRGRVATGPAAPLAAVAQTLIENLRSGPPPGKREQAPGARIASRESVRWLGSSQGSC
jgi:predicted RNase H-like HicB family nuclease